MGRKSREHKNVKSLGIIINEKLNWNDHFKLLEGKVPAGLSPLKEIKSILLQSKLCFVYQALVESYIRYADVALGSLPKNKLHTLQRFQDRALKVENHIKLDQAVMMFKIKNKLCPGKYMEQIQAKIRNL